MGPVLRLLSPAQVERDTPNQQLTPLWGSTDLGATGLEVTEDLTCHGESSERRTGMLGGLLSVVGCTRERLGSVTTRGQTIKKQLRVGAWVSAEHLPRV